MKYLLVALTILLMTSCSSVPSDMSAPELVKWTEDPENGLRKSKSFGELEYILQYRTPEYIIAREMGNHKIDDATYQKRLKELSNMDHYQLRLKIKNSGQDPLLYKAADQSEYYQRDSYYAFNFKNQVVQVLDHTDTVGCSMYHFIQTHGLAPYVDMLFSFKKQKDGNREIVINDDAMNIRNMVFTIEKEKLSQLPKLTI